MNNPNQQKPNQQQQNNPRPGEQHGGGGQKPGQQQQGGGQQKPGQGGQPRRRSPGWPAGRHQPLGGKPRILSISLHGSFSGGPALGGAAGFGA